MTSDDSLIDACYAGVADAGRWPSVLERISEALDARGTLIVSYDPSRTADTTFSNSLSEADEDYRRLWWRFDTRIASAKAQAIRPNAIWTDATIPREQKRKDPFFQEFCARHEIDELIAYGARDPFGGVMTVSACRGSTMGAFQPNEISRFRTIGPHLARAFELTAHCATAFQHAADLSLALERTGLGIILLDDRGRVGHVSTRAERLASGILRLAMNQPMQAIVPAERERLDRLISSVLPGGNPTPSTASLLRSADGRRRLVLEASPTRAMEPLSALVGSRRGGALIVLRDLTPPPSRSIVPHLRQLGLTPSEALVAMAVGRGRSPREVAEGLAVSEATARVHLKAIFNKLQIKRQSELAVLVTRLDCMTGEIDGERP